jgi:flagellar basal body P-ring formation protein FlgA
MAATGFAQVISRGEIIRDVQTSLEKVATQTNSGLKVVSIFQRHDLKVADGKVSWRIDVDPSSLKPGRRSIAVSALVNGVPEVSINVTAVIKRYLEVPVVRQSLKRGSLVRADDIKWQRIEMARKIEGLVRDEEDVIGMMAVRTVREGTPLRLKWFDEPLAIERGERVRVILVQGGLIINTTAIALGKGRIGDTIQLRNPASHVRYEAKVSAPGQARVQTW